MKSISKQILAVLLCALLCLPIFGCNKDKQQPNPNDAVSGKLGLELPKYDLGENKKVKVISHDSSVFKDGTEIFKQAYGGEVEVTTVAQGDVKTKFVNSVLASDPYDLVTSCMTPALIKKNIITPLEEYIDFSSNLWESIYELNSEYRVGGKFYCAIPSEQKTIVVWYNKEIFEENGQKTPLEYLNEDNWNWNTMRELSKNLTIDTDNDGSKDTEGIAFDNPWDILATTGSGILSYDEKGVASNDLGSQRIARTMSYYSDLINKDGSVALQNGKNKFLQSKLAMFYAGYWHAVNFTELLDSGSIALAPQPKDPESDKYYICGGGYVYTLAANSKNPNGAAALLCSQRYFVAENENAERENGAKERIKNAECDKILSEMNLNYKKYVGVAIKDYTLYDLISVPWPMWCGEITEGAPWATVMETLNPIVETALEAAESLQIDE